MNYAVMKDGLYTGVYYNYLNGDIVNHHKARDETLVKINGIVVNHGTDEDPDWQVKESAETPFEVTMRQARIVLHRHGYLSQVAGAILNLSEPQKTEASIEWEYALTVERDSELVSLLQSSLSITDEEVDQMFREAVLI